jgi:hypothetical protein
MQPLDTAWADTEPAAEAPAQAPGLPLRAWVREGLRAALLRAPRTGAAAPTPWQLAVLVLIPSGLLVAVARGHVEGPAVFSLHGWLAPWWTSLVLLWAGWWAMPPARRQGLAAWWVLATWAPLPPTLLVYGLQLWVVQWPARWQAAPWSTVFWVLYGLLALWLLAALLAVSARCIGQRWRSVAFGAAAVAVIGVATWQFQDQPWEEDYAARAASRPEPARLHLSQSLFEAQQALWQRQVEALAGQTDGVADVYGLVFAPYADENVFRNESTMVKQVLEQRFAARGRVLHLLNHAETAQTHVWATPQNLERAIAAIGARMNREEDLLVVYMTSHGASDHRLAARHWPLEVPPVAPEQLRALLDAAGIRHRVIAISACYSGGWVEPLADDDTLVMTAADATHTSYGCGSRSELTFFGRAVFDEQLRHTRSFTQAFEQAVPVIARREEEAGKSDGFSNPQIRVGARIAPMLQALAQRLDAEALQKQ